MVRKDLKWLEHMKKASGETLNERLYEYEVESRRDRGRSCSMWQDVVKNACSARSSFNVV